MEGFYLSASPNRKWQQKFHGLHKSLLGLGCFGSPPPPQGGTALEVETPDQSVYGSKKFCCKSRQTTHSQQNFHSFVYLSGCSRLSNLSLESTVFRPITNNTLTNQCCTHFLILRACKFELLFIQWFWFYTTAVTVSLTLLLSLSSDWIQSSPPLDSFK